MLTILFGILLGGGIGYWIDGEFWGLRILGGLIGLLISFFVAMGIDGSTLNVVHTKSLVALRGESLTSGTFFLGCGSFSGAPHYFYYYQAESGGYRMDTMPADDPDVTIFEEERQDAVLQTLQYSFPKGSHGLLWGIPNSETHYAFRVPSGTIKREFSL